MEESPTVSSKGGKITVHIPLSSFIKEHKTLINVLKSEVQDSILAEAEAQRKELDDIIAKVKEIKNMQSEEMKPMMKAEPMPMMKAEPMPMMKAEPMAMPATQKFKEMMEARRKPMTSMAPDLRKIAPKK
jgi:hypothetical protein